MPPIELRSAPKFNGSGIHRVVPPTETHRRILPLLPRLGVTRLADITGLDRLGIPTYSAVVPDSDDVLSIYNGKGASKIEAKVGAVMEAVERFSALHPTPPIVVASYEEASRGAPAIDPRSLIMRIHPRYTPDSPVAWMEGRDLLSGDAVLVPAQAVGILFEERFGQPCYEFGTSNGLASGNTLEEAVCHALCELIERDAWTMAHLLASYLPQARREKAPQAVPSEEGDDLDRYPILDLDHANRRVKRLLSRFRRAGIRLRVKDITSDLEIPVVIATSAEEVAPGFPLAHFGLGAHPEAEIAVARALTEVAQCRAVDIQGVREDLAPATATDHPFPAHTKRKSRISWNSWFFGESSWRRPLADLPSRQNADILCDIRLMLGKLAAAEIERVVVVDLTHPEIGLPVVRVLAPGCESWAADHGRLGWRATRQWRLNGGWEGEKEL